MILCRQSELTVWRLRLRMLPCLYNFLIAFVTKAASLHWKSVSLQMSNATWNPPDLGIPGNKPLLNSRWVFTGILKKDLLYCNFFSHTDVQCNNFRQFQVQPFQTLSASTTDD